MMMDKGLSINEVENFIQGSGHLTDIVKFGFGTSFVTPNIEEKLKLYKELTSVPTLEEPYSKLFTHVECSKITYDY